MINQKALEETKMVCKEKSSSIDGDDDTGRISSIL